ncbi:Trehalose transport system permease protein SugB [Paenibacillus konkukensis]|uniref:Trehalose transport system permease protein SugB n=1 Tax=Paenibacillus konkukensis TaxID=2020716 RepID=A0ABY4RX56_9BACL|nr:carbohydrate ABC transporter permease [Paenibacillus konkukensis]UQZ86877.1 Trehalose transport system permease protein SugB [Paenibacillus konkukensis]
MKTRLWPAIYQLVLTLAVFLVFTFPFIWMLMASFKTQVQVLSADHIFLFKPTFKNYIEVFRDNDYLRYLLNSFLVALGSTAFALILGLPAAYSIAKYRMHTLGTVILVAKMIPGITFLVPWYILFTKLHMVDTFTVLIVSHMVIGLPFIMWVMIPFFEAFPVEVEESSWIDGSSKFRAFMSIVLPVSVPGIVTAALLSFIFSWNNFMFSLILAGERTKTLPIAVFNFISASNINWGALMAAACVITLPVMIMALFSQKYIVSGLSAGAVKG